MNKLHDNVRFGSPRRFEYRKANATSCNHWVCIREK